MGSSSTHHLLAVLPDIDGFPDTHAQPAQHSQVYEVNDTAPTCTNQVDYGVQGLEDFTCSARKSKSKFEQTWTTWPPDDE
jgi:hypothetical protein